MNSRSSDNKVILEVCREHLASNRKEDLLATLSEGRSSIRSVLTTGLKNESRGLIKVQENLLASISVERGQLLEGLSWMTLFISLAPMLGFMGTVLGMIQAFDAISGISVDGNLSPGLVAEGIRIALITTVSGLVIAVILQLFYNYLIQKTDILVTELEDAAATFVDMLILYQPQDKHQLLTD